MLFISPQKFLCVGEPRQRGCCFIQVRDFVEMTPADYGGVVSSAALLWGTRHFW